MPRLNNQELLRLSAAVCGPLSKGEKVWLFSELRKKDPVAAEGDFPVPAVQPEFPELVKQFRTHEPLRRLCAAVMSRRKTTQGSREYMPMVLRYIAEARYALLCGDMSTFYDMHYRCCKNLQLPHMLKEPELQDFWNGVLGPSWQGIKFLPESNIRKELLSMLALRYALVPRQEDLVPEMARDLPPGLGLGYALLRADKRFAPSKEDGSEEGASLALAYWKLWAGGWQHAYKGFKTYFKNIRELYNRLSSEMCEGLLVVACIVAIRVAAPQRVVELWLSTARDMLDQTFAMHSADMKADLQGFFDALKLWDAVQNRGVRPQVLPVVDGPLTGVALSMAAPAIVRQSGISLPLDRIVSAVLEAQGQGLCLLAAYAASALMLLQAVPEASRESLRSVVESCSFAPLYPAPDMVRPEEETGRSRLSILLENSLASWSDKLFWDVVLDSQNRVVAVEPRMVEGKPQANGKRVELAELLPLVGLSSNSSQDMAMVTLSEALSRSRTEGEPLVAEGLVGHPRLRLAVGGYRRCVQVVSSRPVLRVDLVEASVRLSVDAEQFSRLQEVTEYRFSVPTYPVQLQSILEYFRNGPLQLDIASREELRWLILTLGEFFEIEGQVPESLRVCAPSEAGMVMHMEPEGNGYHFELQVQHMAGVQTFTAPGQGLSALLLHEPDGKLKCVQRDKERELEAANLIVQSCSQLRGVPGGNIRYHWHLVNRNHALQTMSELAENRVPLSWLGRPEDELHVVEADAAAMRYSVHGEPGSWLEIDAELQVDEERVFMLAELLQAHAAEGGSFIHLDGQHYLHISTELAYILDRLTECLRTEGRRYLLPRAALPALAAQWRGKLPEFLLSNEAQLHECDSAPAPRELATSLREYQLEGFRWLLARMCAGLGACLADDMGLGKTVQTLALLLENAAAGPSLVVAPLSLCSNWVSEAKQCAPSLRVQEFCGELGEPRAGEVVVASYGQVVAHEAAFLGVEWNLVALDEAQAIKNPASRRAQVVCKLRAAGRVCLTGTPVENSLMDLWSVMHFLNPYLLGSRSHFVRSGQEQVEKVRRWVAPLILRRTKQQVLSQLPPITEVKIGVELGDDERALYESIRRNALARASKDCEPVTLLAELTRLRRACCHGKLAQPEFPGGSSKLRAFIELVESLHEAGHRALVFSQFTDMLDLAQDELHAHQISTLRLDGSTPVAKRKQLVEAFQNGEAQVFLISLKVGGTGLNLTAADYVILLDPWWNPAVEAQAAGRSHRIGQHKPVTFCRLIANRTIEDYVMQMHSAKSQLAESIIHEGNVPLSTLRKLLEHR